MLKLKCYLLSFEKTILNSVIYLIHVQRGKIKVFHEIIFIISNCKLETASGFLRGLFTSLPAKMWVIKVTFPK